ncbi:hypothetical protein Bbelb_164110 [Branchiostoma belcheri]|nr:hypothetical protein Bbelb_358860 [Branchiostoma belcheri]KAI8506058.1 hypothetical protein Bbelb_164110 [Branchiostoma belcheri]
MVLPWKKSDIWKVPALKVFLRERGLKTTGSWRKAELRASLAYSAVQLGIPVKQDETAEDRARSTHYSELLKVNGTKLPDPLLDLTEGWLKEKDAVEQIMASGRLHEHRQVAAVRGPVRQRTETAARGRIGRQQHCTIVSSATTKKGKLTRTSRASG